MTNSGATIDTLTRLEGLVTAGTLPTKVLGQAQTLLQRAGSPVLIAVLGLPDSGKSQLINLLVGEDVIWGDARFTSIHVAWGETKRTVTTRADGTTDTREGFNLPEESASESTSVLIEIPSDRFNRMNLVETELTGAPADMHDTFDQAVQAADIILWCSQEFTDEEYALWERVPDAKKDHSFMILTKADLLSEQCVLSETIEATQIAVAEEFHSLIPVATIQAIRAKKSGDTDALMASGGELLIKAIMDHVETGRRADLDNAVLFLDRHGASAKRENTGAADVVDMPLAADDDATAFHQDPVPPGGPIPAAIIYLQDRAETMAQSDTEGDDRTEFVLEHCAATSAQLAETMLEESVETPEIQALVDDVMEAADVILLMQMESGIDAAADAVTVLLQLRRGFEAKIAA